MLLQAGAIAVGALVLAAVHTYLERQGRNSSSSQPQPPGAAVRQLPKPDGSTPAGKTVWEAQFWQRAQQLARKAAKR